VSCAFAPFSSSFIPYCDMEKTCRFATTISTTTYDTDTAAAVALARQLEQEYLDEYLARHIQFTINMDIPDHQQGRDRKSTNNNKAMSLLGDLKPDLDCQIYLSDDDYYYDDDDDDDDEEKSNKEDSKPPAIVAPIASNSSKGRASFGAAQTSSSISNSSSSGGGGTIRGQAFHNPQQQQQQQQEHYTSLQTGTFSSPGIAAQRIVAPVSSTRATTTITLSSSSSLRRALLLEHRGGCGITYAPHTAFAAAAAAASAGGAGRLAAAPPPPPKRPSSLQRALLLEKQHAFAQQLQQQYDRELWEQEHSRLEAETLMHTSVTGRAWKFVEKVLALHDQYKQSGLLESHLIVPLATDDLVYLTEKFLRKQAALRVQNRPTTVTLGFHFTTSTNLSQIRSNGLLTKQERQDRNIHSTFNGSVYGDGVYIAADVTVGASGRYGDIGILCACLHGREKKNGKNFHDGGDDQDSNALKLVAGTRMFVLKTSSQCLGIFEFPRSLIENHSVQENIGVLQYWVSLHQLVQDFFNQKNYA
jgi:hypothetical protein